MKMIHEMPEDGKFVVVWSSFGGIWSRECHWHCGVLLEYSEILGWIEADLGYLGTYDNVVYITSE